MLICENSTRGTVASTRFSKLKKLIYTVFKNEQLKNATVYVCFDIPEQN